MKVHLCAVCGTAMASLAGLLRERGHEVTGSDQDVYPPMSTQLEALGIPVRSPYAEANVPADADLVVIGNALSRGNPEVEAVLDRRQRHTSLPALVAEEFLRERRSLVVAGTHGKTTTTSLLAFLLERAGLDPSFLIGGVPSTSAAATASARATHFVIEGDEYDSAFFDKRPKFVHYLPTIAVIGNVEFDHADIYPDLAAVKTAFVRLLQVIPRSGLLVAGTREPGARRDPAAGALPGRDVRARRRGRLAGRGRARGGRRVALPAGSQGPGRGRVRAAARRASTTSGTPWPRSPWPPRPGSSPETLRERARDVPGRQAAARGARRGARRHRLRRLRPSPDGRRGDARGAAGSPGRRDGSWPSSSRARTPPAPASSRTTSPARSRGADRVYVAAAHLPGKVPEAAAALGGRPRGGHRPAGRGAPSSCRPWRRSWRRSWPSCGAGDRVAILSNGGFGGIHEKLLQALAEVHGG